MGGYWKRVTKRALTEALVEVRLEKPVRIVTGLIAPCIAGVVVWYFTGSAAWGGIVTAALLVLVAAALFLGKLFTVPGKMAAEQAAEIEVQRAQIEASQNTVEQKRSIRERLSELMNEGEALARRSYEEPVEAIRAEAEAWATGAHNWLYEELDASYAQHFLSDSGIPMTVSMRHVSDAHENLVRWIHNRSLRLGEFLRAHR